MTQYVYDYTGFRDGKEIVKGSRTAQTTVGCLEQCMEDWKDREQPPCNFWLIRKSKRTVDGFAESLRAFK